MATKIEKIEKEITELKVKLEKEDDNDKKKKISKEIAGLENIVTELKSKETPPTVQKERPKHAPIDKMHLKRLSKMTAVAADECVGKDLKKLFNSISKELSSYL